MAVGDSFGGREELGKGHVRVQGQRSDIRDVEGWRDVVVGYRPNVGAPERVVFTWHPGSEPSSATEVEITFSDRDGQTKVVVTHSGWETFGEKAEETRGGYDKGWDLVLEKYGSRE